MTKKYEDTLFSVALSYLTGTSDKTEKQVRDKLLRFAKKNPPSEEQDISASITNVLARLRTDGFLSDSRYVGNFIHSRVDIQSKLKSRMELVAFLKQKGVGDSLINEGLQSYTPEVESQIIQKIIEKKKKLYTPDKLRNYLLRRGFTPKIVASYLTHTSF